MSEFASLAAGLRETAIEFRRIAEQWDPATPERVAAFRETTTRALLCEGCGLAEANRLAATATDAMARFADTLQELRGSAEQLLRAADDLEKAPRGDE